MIKQKTELPVLVGFGIKDAESAVAVASVSDGVVVGSVLVDAMSKHDAGDTKAITETLKNIVRPIRSALDAL